MGSRKPSTRERLLDTAGQLLGELGIDRVTTNLICERAGVTPPALYYYFGDKYEVIAALGERLMGRQNDALVRWLERHSGGGIQAYAEHSGDLLRETAEITEAEPGGVWIERALHSSPRLEHIRIESHRYVTDKLAEAFAPFLPGRPRDQIWLRMRMLVEFGYVATELLHAETGMSREAILAETTRIQKSATLALLEF
ncbi:MAG: TetR/AcrR family transcriptional regulator [Sphingopyxis sp.]|uniref:TetR/AcrR family transcriptional regulator n=1 Tax=Sphingopyxis sp. TaxID=1908224 RepID=UPI003D6DA06F